MLLAACGTDGGDDDAPGVMAPATCAEMQLAYNHDLALPAPTSGAVTAGGHAFANALSNQPGELILYGDTASSVLVHIYFSELVLDGHVVPARGAITVPGIEAANCETDHYGGSISVLGDGTYKFYVTGLHAGADCSGATIAGGFAGCYQAARN